MSSEHRGDGSIPSFSEAILRPVHFSFKPSFIRGLLTSVSFCAFHSSCFVHLHSTKPVADGSQKTSDSDSATSWLPFWEFAVCGACWSSVKRCRHVVEPRHHQDGPSRSVGGARISQLVNVERLDIPCA